MSVYGDTWESPIPLTQESLANPRISVRKHQLAPVITTNANSGWQNNLVNGLVEPERRPPPVSSGMITKPLHHEKFNDMRHDRFEVINDNSRQRRLKFNDKYRYAKHRPVSFLPQE